MRIVSLLGSATEIVYALGLGEHLVAISHECDYPPEALRLPRASRPRFDPVGLSSGEIDAAVRRCMEEHGGVYEVDRELLRELRPSLVLTQAVCEVCAVPTGSVEETVAGLPDPPRVVSLDAHTLEEILATLHQVADAVGAPERGAAVAEGLRERIDTVASRVGELERPGVLALEWLDPPFAPGHWMPEMVELAGGANLVGEPGARSAEISWPALESLEPEYLFLAPCGYDLARTAEDAERHRPELARAAPGAIQAGRAWLLHSAWFSRSGPRVVEGIEVLARLLHPTRFPEIATAGRAARWAPNLES